MIPYRQIRVDFDRDSIIVYQAYHQEIAVPAIKAGRFVEPFSWGRMTWIKPSFLWLMTRSNWATKPRQKHILAIRIKRAGCERALSRGVLTSFESKTHKQESLWRSQFEDASVYVQWDPERTIHGKKLSHRSIQVGISRDIIRESTDDWILEISDYTARASKSSITLPSGKSEASKIPTAARTCVSYFG